ncbi:MAG: hypothetical protein HQ527_10065 [Cyanobacteria bacterium]|nr:hypothetical protein [Cyanobacteria bacterium bin.51]
MNDSTRMARLAGAALSAAGTFVSLPARAIDPPVRPCPVLPPCPPPSPGQQLE